MSDKPKYIDIPDYLSACLGNPDTSVNTDGVYTRVWTDERIAASEPPDAMKVTGMRISIGKPETSEFVELGEFDAEWSFDKSSFRKPLWDSSVAGYTLGVKAEWTEAGRAWIDNLIYGLSEDARQSIGRKLLDFAEQYARLHSRKPRRSRRAARRRLSKNKRKK